MRRLILGNRSVDLDGITYNGSNIPGDLDSWARLAIGDTPNDFLSDTYDLISQSCLSLYHTFGPAKAAVNKHTDYAVGDGLYFRSRPDYELLGWTKENARVWSKRFQKLIAYKMGALNLYQKQNAAFRWALASGDTVTYFIREQDRPLDIVEFPGSEIDADLTEDGVTLGIKHDRYYRRRGFYNRNGGYIDFAAEGRQQAVQFYLKISPRQLRGWPLIYSNISGSKNNQRFDEATLRAAINEAIFSIITETENPGDTRKQIEDQARKLRRGPIGKAIEAISNLGSAKGIGPGQVLNINSGGKVTPLDKKTPSGTYDAFKNWSMKLFGQGSNTPPEVLLSEYSTAYTAHKGALNDFIKTYLWEREEFNRIWNKTVVKELAIELILEGMIEAPAFFSGGPIIQEAYLKGLYLGPVPGAINPLQEINAKEKSVANMFSLRGDEMFNLSGDDYDDVLEEWQNQERLFRSMGEKEQEAAVAEQDEQNTEREARQ
ncbi:MAG: phage portal protein [Treponema sp.]|jgi:hypothetical protein|nr:phage portal protein [Treponema sp.]